ncbi:MAG TPA: hypothetical protein VL119_10730 [Acidimicrobiia bacterium]|nr:hypothetical protein [Acidimicrobiia bacterium]
MPVFTSLGGGTESSKLNSGVVAGTEIAARPGDFGRPVVTEGAGAVGAEPAAEPLPVPLHAPSGAIAATNRTSFRFPTAPHDRQPIPKREKGKLRVLVVNVPLCPGFGA